MFAPVLAVALGSAQPSPPESFQVETTILPNFADGTLIDCPLWAFEPPEEAEAVAAGIMCLEVRGADPAWVLGRYRSHFEEDGWIYVDAFGDAALFMIKGEPPDPLGIRLIVGACAPEDAPPLEACTIYFIEHTETAQP